MINETIEGNSFGTMRASPTKIKIISKLYINKQKSSLTVTQGQ